MQVIPRGGHIPPISALGDKEASKKTQKILKKNITSLKINKMKDIFTPSCDTVV